MFQKSKVKQAIKSPQNPSEIPFCKNFTQGIEVAEDSGNQNGLVLDIFTN